MRAGRALQGVQHADGADIYFALDETRMPFSNACRAQRLLNAIQYRMQVLRSNRGLQVTLNVAEDVAEP